MTLRITYHHKFAASAGARIDYDSTKIRSVWLTLDKKFEKVAHCVCSLSITFRGRPTCFTKGFQMNPTFLWQLMLSSGRFQDRLPYVMKDMCLIALLTLVCPSFRFDTSIQLKISCCFPRLWDFPVNGCKDTYRISMRLSVLRHATHGTLTHHQLYGYCMSIRLCGDAPFLWSSPDLHTWTSRLVRSQSFDLKTFLDTCMIIGQELLHTGLGVEVVVILYFSTFDICITYLTSLVWHVSGKPFML